MPLRPSADLSSAAWATQQLAEFLATVSGAATATSAARLAVERAAEALDADVAAIVAGADVLAAVGYPEAAAPAGELAAVTPELEAAVLDVPGVGACPAAAAPLDHPAGATLVVARPDHLTTDEAGLLRGMARVASMTMRLLLALEDERGAREELEELAGEHAALRRVATLVAEGAAPEVVFSAVATEVGRIFPTAADAFLGRIHGNAEMEIVGAWSRTADHGVLGRRVPLGGRNVSTLVFESGRPATVNHFARDDDSAITAIARRVGSGSAAGAPINVEGRLWGVMIAGSSLEETLPAATEARLAEFTELVAIAIANAEAREELRRVADEQAALRRVATLIARGASPDVVFDAVAAEVGRVLATDFTLISRYDGAGSLEIVGGWSRAGPTPFVGQSTQLGGHNVSTLVFERNAPARVDRLVDANDTTTLARASGAQSSAGAPVTVEGRLWGVMIVASADVRALPPGIEHRLADFTELIATAIANAQAREELRRTADEQAALRRVATLVARAPAPAELFAAVAMEVGRLFAVQAELVRYDPGQVVTIVGAWSPTGNSYETGRAFPLGGHNASTLVFETGRPARIDAYRADDSSAVTAAARKTGGLGAVGAPISVAGQLWGAAIVVVPREEELPADTEARLADFGDLVAAAIANTEARDALRCVADEQAALRRVATLVARGASPSLVLATVAEEAGRLLSVDHAYVTRFDGDDAVTVMAGWTANRGGPPIELPRRFAEGPMSGLIRATGSPARLDPYPGDPAATPLEDGVRSVVSAPITVKGRLWGFMTVASTRADPPPPETEERLAIFTELVATAIANAEAQAELTASRARIVASADETRRRIERDLHDGAQQRLVALALQLRAAQAAVPPGLGEVAADLERVAAGLNAALDELREFARGIHPAALADGGLGPALKALARRSPIAVDLDIRAERRLPEPVEVAAYYVVSEALTNVAKHAGASSVAVEVEANERVLRIDVRDDGMGGAEFVAGSGLVGLRDRVEALGGRITLRSEAGSGTALSVELPITSPPAHPEPRARSHTR